MALSFLILVLTGDVNYWLDHFVKEWHWCSIIYN